MASCSVLSNYTEGVFTSDPLAMRGRVVANRAMLIFSKLVSAPQTRSTSYLQTHSNGSIASLKRWRVLGIGLILK